jgi:hypothetical protein
MVRKGQNTMRDTATWRVTITNTGRIPRPGNVDFSDPKVQLERTGGRQVAVSYALDEPAVITIFLHDLQGRLISSAKHGAAAGRHSGPAVSAHCKGIYLYTVAITPLRAGAESTVFTLKAINY